MDKGTNRTERFHSVIIIKRRKICEVAEKRSPFAKKLSDGEKQKEIIRDKGSPRSKCVGYKMLDLSLGTHEWQISLKFGGNKILFRRYTHCILKEF